MIRIDGISFEFTAPDEAFAHRLYAGWDGFCRECFERVVEECLAGRDKDKALHVLERIDLDLGSIPEEDFYEEFPRRLKDALIRSLPSWGTQESGKPTDGVERAENLLFFLEHGYPVPEWADAGFDMAQETEWLTAQPSAIREHAIRRLALLCLQKGYALRRLLLQEADEQVLMGIYPAAIAEASAGMYEKRRLLALFIEARPRIPLGFIHRAGNDEALRGMAELLDGTVVGGIIRTETEEHAEVDIPAYWHYLYEWLIQYYPYNGLAIFGGKAEFVRHLHHRLLTFIRKRGGSPYLSKTELTAGFLLEVFGAAYYKDVLNAIYRMQPRNADGSPVYGGYLNRELYMTLLRLSLLELPDETDKERFATQKPHVYAEKTYAFLQENDTSNADKRALLKEMVRHQPELLLEWLQREAVKDEKLLPLLLGLVDDDLLNHLLASLSFTALEIVENVREWLEQRRAGIDWLKGIANAKWQSALRKAVLQWMAEGKESQSDAVVVLLRLFYKEVNGGSANDAVVETLAEELSQRESQIQPDYKDKTNSILVSRLQKILSDTALEDATKRRAVAAFWEAYRADYAEAIILLQARRLLQTVIKMTANSIKEEIIHHQAILMFGAEQSVVLLPLFIWLAGHETELPRIQTGACETLEAALLYWLANQT